jgi:hypothetical protein
MRGRVAAACGARTAAWVTAGWLTNRSVARYAAGSWGFSGSDPPGWALMRRAESAKRSVRRLCPSRACAISATASSKVNADAHSMPKPNHTSIPKITPLFF